MMYSILDYQGKELQVPAEQASAAANVAGLIEIEVNGQTHYLNPKNIASIKPIATRENQVGLGLPAPDYRGIISPAKEELRKRYGKDSGTALQASQ